MANLKDKFLDLLFPRNFTCDFCGKEIDYSNTHICEECYNSLPWTEEKCCNKCGGVVLGEEKFCIHCKTSPPDFFMARAPFEYKGVIAGKLKSFKYDNQRYLAETFAPFLAKTYKDNFFDVDIIVPIPLHEKRLLSRGFNQAELLANELSKLIDKPVVNALSRIKETQFQASLNYDERQENLKDSFLITKEVKSKKILLIDDIFTTGATIRTASKLLRKKGESGRIYVLTVGRTIIEQKI